MKLLVAFGLLALAVLATSQESTTESGTQSPECVAIKGAVKGAFRACFPGDKTRRPPGGIRPPNASPRPTPSPEDKNATRICLMEQIQANSTLSQFVSACPESAQPDLHDRLKCIKNQIKAKGCRISRRRGGRRGGTGRPGGPRDGPKDVPRGEPELDDTPDDDE